MFWKLLCIFSVIVLTLEAKNEEYKGHRIYKVKFNDEEQQSRFEELKSELIDYLKKPSLKYNQEGKVLVPPSHFEWFEQKLKELGIDVDVAVPDVHEYLDRVGRNISRKRRNVEDRDFDFNGYYRYDEILAHLRKLETENTDTTTTVNVVEIGRTDEDRPIVYLKIAKDSNADLQKPVVIVEAGINPREWITVPSALYIANKVLENVDQILDKADWIVLPVLNPDGYEYTHTNLRFWTKNRSLRSSLGFICPGANINRNFNLAWQLFDSSSSPCSHIYAGTEPFSEPETQALRSLVDEFASRTRIYFSIQNNGGFVSYPWSYERASTGMFRQHHLLGLEMIRAVNEAVADDDNNYRLDVTWQALGDRVSGTSSDYVQDNGVLNTFNIDVVQRGVDGVSIPEDEIIDHIEDVWKAVNVATNRLL